MGEGEAVSQGRGRGKRRCREGAQMVMGQGKREGADTREDEVRSGRGGDGVAGKGETVVQRGEQMAAG